MIDLLATVLGYGAIGGLLGALVTLIILLIALGVKDLLSGSRDGLV